MQSMSEPIFLRAYLTRLDLDYTYGDVKLYPIVFLCLTWIIVCSVLSEGSTTKIAKGNNQ